MSEEKILDCYYNYLDEVRGDKVYNTVLRSFSDTLYDWIDRDLRGVRYLATKNWMIDSALFFNENKDKVLLFLIAIDKDISHPVASIQIVAAENINYNWQYYIQSYPTLHKYTIELDDNTEIAFKQLSEYGIRRLSSDGYVRWITRYYCWVNYDYIDTDVWFADWRRVKHQEFLESKW